MYGHGFATLALCEVYGMTHRADLKPKVEAAIQLIEDTQTDDTGKISAYGGWRYQPRKGDADISVTVVQVLALRAARNAGLKVAQSTIDRAINYMRRCSNYQTDGGFNYQVRQQLSGPARTGAGVLSLMMAGLARLARVPGRNPLSGQQSSRRKNDWTYREHYYYTLYYITQAMYQVGGDHWKAWYPMVRDILLRERSPDGSWSRGIGSRYRVRDCDVDPGASGSGRPAADLSEVGRLCLHREKQPGSNSIRGLLALWPQRFCSRRQRRPQQKPAKKPDRPAPADRTDHGTYLSGGRCSLDTQERTVICTGEINMDEGPIEYLAVAPGGKTHESLLRIDVRPLHLQLALLMLDLEPKNVLSRQGEKTTPQGDPVELRIRWRDKDGQAHDVRAEELVADGRTEKPMPAHAWVFTGSHVLKQGFQADLEKSLVAVWHDPAAILDNPLPGGGDNAWIVNAKRTPRRGTRVDFVIKAVKRIETPAAQKNTAAPSHEGTPK